MIIYGWEPDQKHIQNLKSILFVGVIGGTFSALAGSGVDICSFSVLCLLFRVSEKVATPTSIVLMAVNTCVGFFWRALMTDGKFLNIKNLCT